MAHRTCTAGRAGKHGWRTAPRCVQNAFVEENGAITANFDARIYIARCQIAWHSESTGSGAHRSADEAVLLTLPSGVVLKIKSLESLAVLTQWYSALSTIPKARPSALESREDAVSQPEREWAGVARNRPAPAHSSTRMLFCPRELFLGAGVPFKGSQ